MLHSAGAVGKYCCSFVPYNAYQVLGTFTSFVIGHAFAMLVLYSHQVLSDHWYQR